MPKVREGEFNDSPHRVPMRSKKLKRRYEAMLLIQSKSGNRHRPRRATPDGKSLAPTKKSIDPNYVEAKHLRNLESITKRPLTDDELADELFCKES